MLLIGPFEAIELVSLLFSLIAFVFIYKAYRIGISDHISKKFWTYFLLIALFVLLGRLFDNLDDLAFEHSFNLLQHLSSIAVAIAFVLVGKNTLEGGLHGWLCCSYIEQFIDQRHKGGCGTLVTHSVFLHGKGIPENKKHNRHMASDKRCCLNSLFGFLVKFLGVVFQQECNTWCNRNIL